MRFVEPDFGLLSAGEKRKITLLRKDLLSWFGVHGRDLPWRKSRASDYEKICVEVLLQRTRAETVASIYPAFFTRFKFWTDIAEASIPELEAHLKPVGLWRRRALSIKGLATFASNRDGNFPREPSELGKIPGVGQYVMNAILLFQHGARRPLVDVNMARVLERFVKPRKLADIRYDPWLQAAAHWLVQERPIETNWAALDFAAKVCAARAPACGTCPVRGRCDWLGRQLPRQTAPKRS
jgi:A/G-specific adenine glycosylase